MQRSIIRRATLTLGALAVLTLSSGLLPRLPGAATPVQAAEISAHSSGSGVVGRDLPRGDGDRDVADSHRDRDFRGDRDGRHDFDHHQFWGHVHDRFRYFYGPFFQYDYDWYFWRHISFPWLYVTYDYEPVGVCVTEYYFYEGVYYCYAG